MNTKVLGKVGEHLALEYLKNKGFVVIATNHRNKMGEIDLIMKDKNVLVFIEVKARVLSAISSPEDALTPRKLKKLQLLARVYVFENKWLGPYRIDAVCIVYSRELEPQSIRHYKDILAHGF